MSAQQAAQNEQVKALVTRQKWGPIGLLIAVLVYLLYAWGAFNMTEVLGKARMEKGVLLLSDAVAHKVHVVQDLRRDQFTVSVEGERTATYDESRPIPAWVQGASTDFQVSLSDGYRVVVKDRQVRYQVPGYGDVLIEIDAKALSLTLPPGQTALPDGFRFGPTKFDARPQFNQRLQVSRSKIEVHRYFFGWENFWFPFRSAFHGLSVSELWTLTQSGERVDPTISNVALMIDHFWNNPDWQHGIIAVAIFETVLMAVLGTMTAAIIALPLAFIAARNFNPEATSRFLIRRVFDFVRGIDTLIWSLIFIRAFGLGPLTGIMAIAVTDAGSFGKLFSEAMENVDNKQIQGIEATGANRVQKYRYGVLPQLMPVFLSQFLYWMESNMRSATVIGALGAGGIGLVLVETMRTQRDWENVFYIIVLTILMVVIMDSLSGRLRQRLITGGKPR